MVTLTPDALAEARRRIADKNAEPVLRVDVKDGGCAGRKYDLSFGGGAGPGDGIHEQDGVRVVWRKVDLGQLRGLRVDHVDALMGGGFRYENPNAGGTCGCGDSFKPLQSLGDMAP